VTTTSGSALGKLRATLISLIVYSSSSKGQNLLCPNAFNGRDSHAQLVGEYEFGYSGNMRNLPGTLQEGGAAFPMTCWSVVVDTLQSQSPERAQAALSDFCQAYWPPVYTFLRRKGYTVNDAQDMAQAFFARLLEMKTLSRADSDKGRLRTFLLASLENFLCDQRDRETALKRGGGRQIVSMQDPLVEMEASILTQTMPDDCSAYDKAWATALFRRTWEQLRQAYAAEGRERMFDELKILVLGGTNKATSQEEVAGRLNLPPATLRAQLHRIRQRYRNFLRDEVARTVRTSIEVDAEMSYLFRLLTS